MMYLSDVDDGLPHRNALHAYGNNVVRRRSRDRHREYKRVAKSPGDSTPGLSAMSSMTFYASVP